MSDPVTLGTLLANFFNAVGNFVLPGAPFGGSAGTAASKPAVFATAAGKDVAGVTSGGTKVSVLPSGLAAVSDSGLVAGGAGGVPVTSVVAKQTIPVTLGGLGAPADVAASAASGGIFGGGVGAAVIGSAGLPGAGASSAPIAFEFTGAAEAGLLERAGAGALGGVAVNALQPSVGRPRLATDVAATTVELAATPARFVFGIRRVGMVLCYFAERNVAEGKVRRAEGLRSFQRTIIILPEEFRGAGLDIAGGGRWSWSLWRNPQAQQYPQDAAGNPVYGGQPFWPTGEGSGSIGIYAGFLCEGQAGEPLAAWFGDQLVPGVWNDGAFRPTADGEQRKWLTGYKVAHNQDDDLYDDEGNPEGDNNIGRPELLMAFGDGTFGARDLATGLIRRPGNVDGPFGRLMRAMTGPRLWNPDPDSPRDGTGFNWAFTPPGKPQTHQVFSSKNSDQGVDADFELDDWLGPTPTSTPASEALLAHGSRWPRWDVTHTGRGISMLGVFGASRHAAGGPGLLDAGQVLLPGPEPFYSSRWRRGYQNLPERFYPDTREVAPYSRYDNSPGIARNAADTRYWIQANVRRTDAARINLASYVEARAICGELLEHPEVPETWGAGSIGLLILKATYGEGSPAAPGRIATGYHAVSDADRRRCIRWWNLAYAGPSNADIRYPCDLSFESPGPAEIEAIEAAMDDCWLGRTVEIGDEIFFRPGIRRPARWAFTEDDFADEPDFTVIPVESQIIDGFDVLLPQARHLRHAEWTRRYLRDPTAPGDAVNIHEGPQVAAVTGGQHAWRLTRAMLLRTDKNLPRMTVAFLLGDGQARSLRMGTVAGDVIEGGVASNGISPIRWEVASVDRSRLRMGVIVLQLAAEPEDLWEASDDWPMWDYQSPILDERLREEDLGAIVPQARPTPEVEGDCPAEGYGYPGMRLRIRGLLWERWWDDGWPEAGTGGVVWSANAQRFVNDDGARAKRIVLEEGSGASDTLSEADARIASRYIDGGTAGALVKQIQLATQADNRIRVFLGLATAASASVRVDLLSDIERNMALVFRDADIESPTYGAVISVVNDPLDTADPYVWRFAPGTAAHRDLANFFRLPFTFQESISKGGIYDVAIVDRRGRCAANPRSPWFRIQEELGADSGGPYRGEVLPERDIGGGGSFFGRIVLPPVPAVIELTGQGLGGSGQYTYAWSDISGATVTGTPNYAQQTIQLTYNSPGLYQATLTVTDAVINADTGTHDTAVAVADILITGEAEPLLNAYIDGPSSGVAGESLTFMGRVDGREASGLTYAWTVQVGSGAAQTQSSTTTSLTYQVAEHETEDLLVRFTASKTLADGNALTRTASLVVDISDPQLQASATLTQEWTARTVDGGGLRYRAMAECEARFGVGQYAYAWEFLNPTQSLTTAQLAAADVDAAAGPVIARATGNIMKQSGQIRSDFDGEDSAPLIPSRYMVNEQTAYLRRFRIDTSANPQIRFVIALAPDATGGSPFDDGSNLGAHALQHFFAILQVDGVPDVVIQMLGTVDNTEPYDFFAGVAGKAWADAVNALPAANPGFTLTIYDDLLNTGDRILSGANAAAAVFESPDGAAETVRCKVTDDDGTTVAALPDPLPIPEFEEEVLAVAVSIANDGRWRLASGTAGGIGAVFEAVLTATPSGGREPYLTYAWERVAAGTSAAPLWGYGMELVDGDKATATYRFTADATRRLPVDGARVTIHCDVTDSNPSTPAARGSATVLPYLAPDLMLTLRLAQGWRQNARGQWVAHVAHQISNALGRATVRYSPTPDSGFFELATYIRPTRPTEDLVVEATATDPGRQAPGNTATARLTIPGLEPVAPEFGVSVPDAQWQQIISGFDVSYRATLTATASNAAGAVTYEFGDIPGAAKTVADNVATYTWAFSVLATPPPASTTVEVTATDAGPPRRTATDNPTITLIGVTPPAAELDFTINPGAWQHVATSGAIGTTAARYEAKPTLSIDGGTGPYSATWAHIVRTGVSWVGGNELLAPTLRYTPAASRLYPPSTPLGISCTVSDSSTPRQTVGPKGSSVPGYTPPTVQPIRANVSIGRWAVADGSTAGEAGAVYEASASVSASGGQPPYGYRWAIGVAGVSASSRTVQSPTFSWTASSAGQYPPRTFVRCTVSDASAQTADATPGGYIPAWTATPPEPPEPPEPEPTALAVSVADTTWTGPFGTGFLRHYAATLTANASGGDGSYTYVWGRTSGGAYNVGTRRASSVSLRSLTAGDAVWTCTVTDGTGARISGSGTVRRR